MIQSLPAKSILPMVAVLEMTYRCNHACKFCSCPWYAERDLVCPEMDTAEWKALIDEFCRAGVNNFAFTGGEALMRDDLLEIMDYAAKAQAFYFETIDGKLTEVIKPPQLFLLSNGKLMSEEVLAFCKKHAVHLSLSLPGLETFGEITQGGMDAAHILGWFKQAKAMGVTTTAGITVTKLNFHELYENIAAALIAGADTILLNRFMPGGRGLDNRSLELSLEEIQQISVIADEVLTKAGRNGHIGTELPLCVTDPSGCETLVVGTRCSAASDFVVVGPNGQLRVCNHSPVELLHWRDYEQLREHPYWRKFVLKQWTPEGCEGCSQLGVNCDGGCREAAHVANGSPDAPDPLWQGASPREHCSFFKA